MQLKGFEDRMGGGGATGSRAPLTSRIMTAREFSRKKKKRGESGKMPTSEQKNSVFVCGQRKVGFLEKRAGGRKGRRV